jgi:ComF family protein
VAELLNLVYPVILSNNYKKMNLFSKLIDLIYPPRCPICRAFLWNANLEIQNNTFSLCQSCFSEFREIASPLCPVCSRPFVTDMGEDHLCENCLRKMPFYEAIRAPYVYEGTLMKAIHQFKYGAKGLLADSLGPLLAQFAKSLLEESDDYLTMPVPLHAKRLRERGFNQSLLLARHVARHLHTKLDFLCLKRVRYTQPQTGLKKEERRKNVRRAFQLENPEAVEGETILLIDDVATTGNTLNECARVLKRAGCKKVFCLVLARATNY